MHNAFFCLFRVSYLPVYIDTFLQMKGVLSMLKQKVVRIYLDWMEGG